MNNVMKSVAAWAVIIILILFVVLLREKKAEPPVWATRWPER